MNSKKRKEEKLENRATDDMMNNRKTASQTPIAQMLDGISVNTFNVYDDAIFFE